MNYRCVKKGIFLSRPNRFIAEVMIDGRVHTVHVKNTGRCKELLLEGATVYLEESENPNRKTALDLIAVEKMQEDGSFLLINMDSQIANGVVEEWLPSCGLFSENLQIRREVFFGASRFDLFVRDGERRAFIEVKGVTLEREGVALFPDAPTLRGTKHVKELADCIKQGFEAYVIFLVQMKGVNGFCPNENMDPAFSLALREARKKGVGVLCVDCRVSPDAIVADQRVELLFGSEAQA